MDVGEFEPLHRGRFDAIYRTQPDGGFKCLRPDYRADERQLLKDTIHPVPVFDRRFTGLMREAFVLRQWLSRAKLLPFFAGLPRCLVGMEICASANYGRAS